MNDRDRDIKRFPLEVDVQRSAPGQGLYLPLQTLSLYCHSVVIFVLGLDAETTHALLFIPAEHLQQPLVLLTHPVLQVLHRINQLMQLQGGDSLVRLQVSITVWGQTHQAGLLGPHLQGCGGTDITHHLTRSGCVQRQSGWAGCHLPKCVRQLFESCVDAYFRPALEWSVTAGAPTNVATVPHILYAGLAEVVSAGSGYWIG